MLDLGVPLEPPQRLGAGRHGEADQRQKRDEERDAETRSSRPRWSSGGMTLHRSNSERMRKTATHEEGPQQRFPDALADERKPAQADAPLEAAGERGILRRVRGRFSCGKRISHLQPRLTHNARKLRE